MREMGNFLLLERTVGNVSSLLSTGLYQSHNQSSYPPLVTSQQGVCFILIKELTSEVYPYAFEISIKNIFYVRFWGFFLLFFHFLKPSWPFTSSTSLPIKVTVAWYSRLSMWSYPTLAFKSHPSQPPGTSPVTKVSLTVHKHSLMSTRLCLSLLLLFSQPKIFKTTFSNIFIILWELVSSAY